MTPAMLPVTALARQVLAPNPGPMTLDGTQSYLLALPGAAGAVIVDPGPDDEAHLQALASAGPVELILVTHRHADHTAGIDRLHALTGAPVRAVLPEFCRAAPPLLAQGETGSGTGAGESIHAAGLRIDVVPAPGHTSDSVCFHLPDDGAKGSVLTGDTILGRGTTILDYPDGTLGDYLATLDRLSGFGPAAVLPAHGPALPDLEAVVADYRAHRLARLRQVRDAVVRLDLGALTPEPRTADTHRVTDVVYADVDHSVRGAAEHSVAAQLAYLATLSEAERAAL